MSAWDRAVQAHTAGDLKAAIDAYRHAAHEGDPDAAYHLGSLLYDRGEFEAAAAAFEQAAAAGDEDALLNVANLLADVFDRPEDAVKRYREAIAAGSSRGLLELGEFFARQDEFSEAEAVFRQAVENGDPRGHLCLGRLLANAERDDDAITEFRQAMAAGIEGAEPHLGAALTRLGLLAEAESVLGKGARRQDPESARLLGEVLHLQGRTAEAEGAFLKALEGGWNIALLDYADLLADEGRLAEAMELRERALELGIEAD
jgi:tetratricopeptide (TPR) repeat protein